jgi:hydroxymethylbilane synthase
VADALVTRAAPTGHGGEWRELPDGARVATSSVRRQRQLQWLRPGLAVTDIRGNVPTRLRKLATRPELDALLLAEAGLRRLGHANDIVVEGVPLRVTRLDPAEFLPAAGQGAVALEARADDARWTTVAQTLNCPGTMAAVTAEREFLRLLGAGCDTPVGVRGHADPRRLHLAARVFRDGEDEPLEAAADAPRDQAAALARRLVAMLKQRKS